MSNETIKNDVAIVLDWEDVASATKYHCQVSKKYLDFRATLEEESDVLATSTMSFNLATPTDGDKFYWRWKSYVDGAWGKWSEVSMFIYDSTLSADLLPANDKWLLINPATVTDYYEFELAPLRFDLPPEALVRAEERNMAGDLLAEYYGSKHNITLDFSQYEYLGENQRAEVLRFFHLNTSVYLSCAIPNSKSAGYRHLIYEVVFANNPSQEVVGSNTLEFKEV